VTVTATPSILASLIAAAKSCQGRLGPRLAEVRAAGLFGEATLILCGQITAAVGGIIGVPLLAHYLRPEDYGRLALGGTVAALVQQVSLGPLGNAGQRFYAASTEANSLRDYLRSVARVTLTASTFVAAVGGVALVGLACSPWRGSLILAGWSLIFAILAGVSSVFDGIQTAARQRAIVAWHQGLDIWLRYGIAALFVRLFGGAEIAMAGFAVAVTVTMLSQVFFFRRAILSSHAYRPGFDPVLESKLRRQMWVYARPFSSWGLFTWAQIASDRWALDAFTTTRSVGIYQALYQLGYYPISMASVFLNQLFQPLLFARAGEGNDDRRMANAYKLTDKLFIAVLILTLGGASAAGLLSTTLFHLLLPAAYGSVSNLLPLVVLAAGIFVCGQVASLKHALSPNPQTLIAPKIVTALMGAGLNFAGAYLFGVKGVVAAGLCFSIAYCIWVIATVPKLKPASAH
jgi:O-antigen/teichoic acid export membrane protein